MNSISNYTLEANIGFIFFYGIYYLLLRNETDFSKQRIFLLSGLMCALVFPLIHIEWGAAEPVLSQTVSNVTIVLPEMLIASVREQSIASADILLAVYIAVALILAVPLLSQARRLYCLFKKDSGRYRDDFYVIESNSNRSSWSFFRLIFIGQADQLSADEKELVVRHEMLHGRLLHSADILIVSVLCILCWFNPIVWIYRRTLARVHEFEVDTAVAGDSNTTDYGILLAKTALTGNGLLLTHHFNQSFILKRINMLNIIKNRVSTWKLTALATTIAIYFVAVACTEQVSEHNAPAQTIETPAGVTGDFTRLKEQYPSRNLELIEVTDPKAFYKIPPMEGKSIMRLFTFPETGRAWLVVAANNGDGDREVFTVVEETATPANGVTAFYEQLSNRLVYPEQARKQGVEGKVFVEFVVAEDGLLTDFKVVKGIGAGCDSEAIKALAQMEPWKPGRMNGNAVAQKMVMPIMFRLN